MLGKDQQEAPSNMQTLNYIHDFSGKAFPSVKFSILRGNPLSWPALALSALSSVRLCGKFSSGESSSRGQLRGDVSQVASSRGLEPALLA